MNRLTNVVQLANGSTSASAWYAYDAAGRLHHKGYGNGDVVTHAYDTESRLLSLGITNGAALVTRYNYQWDAGGNILAITNNGTNITLYGYDRVGQLTNEICFTNGVAGRTTNAWVYDEAGNWLNANPTNRWCYNTDNELVARAATNDTTWNVTVTGEVEPGPNSNKWYNTWASSRGVSARVSTNDGTFVLPDVPLNAGTNELVVTVTDVSGNQSQQTRTVRKKALEIFHYDGNGNLTNWINGAQNWTYQWDWVNRLTKVTSNGITVLENWYDASSRRIAKKEVVGGQTKYTMYVSDGWNSAVVLNQAAQVLESLTRGVGLAGDIGTLVAVTHHPSSVANGTFYTHHNHRGDITFTRVSTVTIGQCDYTPFGSLKTQTGSDICRFKFSSKERDITTGFGYCWFRFYSPQWGRWLNRDPLEEIDGVNLYSYVGNNPINRLDPWGLFKNPNWPPIKPPPGGPRPPGPGLGNWMGLLISAASAMIDIDCQSKCPRSSCESCCKLVATTMSALNAGGFVAGCVGSGGWFCFGSGVVAILAERQILRDLDSCMEQCQSKSP